MGLASASYNAVQDAPAPAPASTSDSQAAPAAAPQAPAEAPPAAAADAPAATPDAGAVPSAAAPAGKPGPAQSPPPEWFQFLPFIVMAFLFYMLLLRPQQKEQARRRELLNQLKKNDRVVTTGGVIGTITDLSADNRFVTLKVDDSTRIRFLRSAIHGPLDDKSEPSEKK